MLHNGDGLPEQGVLEAVGQKAGHILLHQHRMLARAVEDFKGALHCFIGHLLRADNLYQRNQIGRVPVVGADNAFLVGGFGGNLRDADGGGVGGQDGVRPTDAVQLLEKVLLHG